MGHTWKNMAKLAKRILSRVYNLGSIIPVESFVHLFDSEFIKCLERNSINESQRCQADLMSSQRMSTRNMTFTNADRLLNYVHRHIRKMDGIVGLLHHYDITLNVDTLCTGITKESIQKYLENDTNNVELSEFAKILLQIFFQPTKYFSRDGIILLPFNICVNNMRFINTNDEEICSTDYLFDSDEYIIRDSITNAIQIYARQYYHTHNRSLMTHLNQNDDENITAINELFSMSNECQLFLNLLRRYSMNK
jgi:hypothetical protein